MLRRNLSRISAPLFAFVFSLLSLQPALAAPGDLVKLACPSGADAAHPCRAVYYSGGDGRRHAFPNERTYFSWYADFSGVKTVDAAAMASLPLGANVTYRPGSRLVKFPTVPKVYAVSAGGTLRWVTTEAAAVALYGAGWNAQVDDLSEAFYGDYRFGTDIAAASDFAPAAELAAAPTIDADAGMSYAYRPVTTARGTFDAYVVTLRKDRFAMSTSVAAPADCADDCAAKPLVEHASGRGAGIAIHGTYFCPPDYADCAAKTNTFLAPVYDAATDAMRNASSLVVHEGPMLAHAADGRYFYFHRTKDFGASVADFETAKSASLAGAIANYPSLIEGGVVVVESESRLDEGMRTVKATRGGIGMNATSVFLVVARSATVVDLAAVLQALGATDALNLDGGGSAALLYGGTYKVGPGRLLPNAILFTRK